MTINIKLSDASIGRAIRRLRLAQDHLRWGVQDTVEILAKDGAEIANQAYGGMAEAIDYLQDSALDNAEAISVIAVVGETNLIAEFGAGDATDPATGFENEPDTPVYAGSYSELEGSNEYAKTGQWHFGGRVYTEVPARRGLMSAKAFIVEQGAEIAKEVIKL